MVGGGQFTQLIRYLRALIGKSGAQEIAGVLIGALQFFRHAGKRLDVVRLLVALITNAIVFIDTLLRRPAPRGKQKGDRGNVDDQKQRDRDHKSVPNLTEGGHYS